MKASEGEATGFLLTVLSSFAGREEVSQLNGEQWLTIKSMWAKKPTYGLADLISNYDTAEAHAILFAAFSDNSHDLDIGRMVAYYGIGRPKTPLNKRHLRAVLEVMGHRPDAIYIGLIARMEGADAQAALETFLLSDEPRIFAETYRVLAKQGTLGWRSKALSQNARLRSDQTIRALMIAEALWPASAYGSKLPTAQDINFFGRHYERDDISETSRLISFTTLVNMRYRIRRDIGGKGQEHLPSLLTQVQAFLMADKEGFQRRYFDVFDTQLELGSKGLKYNYLVPSRFNGDLGVKGEDMDNPKAWSARFRSYLQDERVANIDSVMQFLADNDEDMKSLKSALLQTMEDQRNIYNQMHAMLLIAQKPSLRSDVELRQYMKPIAKGHPITKVRAAAQLALSDRAISQKIFRTYRAGYYVFGAKEDDFMRINKTRPYCDGPKHPQSFKAEDLPVFPRFWGSPYLRVGGGTVAVAMDIGSGWLIGYNRGEWGGELIYYPNKAEQGIVAVVGQVYGLIRGADEGQYWLVTGNHHMMDMGSDIHEVIVSNDSVAARRINHISRTPHVSAAMAMGELFMDYRAKPMISYDMKTKEMKITPDNPNKYNPPLLLTKTGEVVAACE